MADKKHAETRAIMEELYKTVLEAGSAFLTGAGKPFRYISRLLKLLERLRAPNNNSNSNNKSYSYFSSSAWASASASASSAQATNTRHLQSFVNWLREHKVKNVDHLRIERVAEGLGVIANKDVKQGEVLFEVPEELFFTPKVFHNNPKLSKLLDSELVADTPNVQLIVALIAEKYNGSSKWLPYIHILPTSFITPLHWTEEDWQLFHEVSMEDKFYHIATLFITQLRLFTAVYQLLDKHPDAMDRTILTWDNWAWAAANVLSRANTYPNMENNQTRLHFERLARSAPGEDAITEAEAKAAAEVEVEEQTGWKKYQMLNALIPIYDSFNHGILAPHEMKSASDSAATRKSEYDVIKRVMEVLPIRDTKRDEQIYIWYGHRPNSLFFESQGFIPENNPYDIGVLYGTIPESDPFYVEKLAILQRLNMFRVNKDKVVLFPLPADLSAPSTPSTFFFRLMCIQEKDYINPKIVTRSYAENSAISWENEILAMNFLGMKIQSRLSQYPTTIDDDKKRIAELTAKKALTPTKKLIIQYVISEKALLEKAHKQAADMKTKAEAKKAKKDKEKQKKAAK